MSEDDETMPADLARLRAQFPAWRFGTVWTSADSGPDKRRLTAIKGRHLAVRVERR